MLLMKVEFSKEQKAALGQKIALCVEFLKSEVQPHIVKSDVVIADVGEDMELYITSKKIYVKETQVITLGVDIYRKRVFELEKPDRKKSRKYICDVSPESALEFLKNWETAKNFLMEQVAQKNKEVDAVTTFVDEFQL